MCSLQVFLFQKHYLPDRDPHLLSRWPDTSLLQDMSRQAADSEYILLYLGTTPVQLHPDAVERMVQAAEMSGADLLYSDYYETKDGQRTAHPTLDYQWGSLRDDFDFGPLLLFRTATFCREAGRMHTFYRYAALYDLRLKISQQGKIVRLPEYLYTIDETDSRSSGEKQFDYVNPKNRAVQIEMEQACTEHLKTIGAWLAPEFEEIDSDPTPFPVEASVVIPVKNRAKTIADAVHSALQQQTRFAFNVIVVDNHSEDATTTILAGLTRKYPSLIHHIPSSHDLGIGGCWNEAIAHPACGKFAIQLDSDDLYNGPEVLQTIVDTFYKQKCALVIGSYRMVNFQLEEIPPGLIDHSEWTPENGRNNALRINGLGAPRAFYTPVLRKIKFPNVNYGEDYATALAISRTYRVGRIYTPLYLCRRWEGNSDAALDIRRLNTNNAYKDKIRTLEILCRTSLNQAAHEK